MFGEPREDVQPDLAVLKLERYANEEIAMRLGWSLRTVERRLRGIRAIWSEENTA